jgi:hypothetical protein
LLAASYALERGLVVTALVPDFHWFPVDAVERRDAFLVSATDAAVVVRDERDPNVRRLQVLVDRRGIPVHVIGGPPRVKVRRETIMDAPVKRGLPD